jgi:hypothetical protein
MLPEFIHPFRLVFIITRWYIALTLLKLLLRAVDVGLHVEWALVIIVVPLSSGVKASCRSWYSMCWPLKDQWLAELAKALVSELYIAQLKEIRDPPGLESNPALPGYPTNRCLDQTNPANCVICVDELYVNRCCLC